MQTAPSNASFENARQSEKVVNLPTNQDHWAVLHVFQLTNSGMLRLFALDSSANYTQKLPFFGHPALIAVKAEAVLSPSIKLDGAIESCDLFASTTTE